MMTSSFGIATFILFALFFGATLGLLIGRRLPAHHLTGETKAVVSATMAVVGTMSALVIGLMISNGSTAFKARNADVSLLASQIVQLDTLLRRYGSDADEVRHMLSRYATMTSKDLFPDRRGMTPNVDNSVTRKALDEAQDLLLTLKSSDDRQRWLSAQALQSTLAMGETRARMSQENVGSIPLPFLGAVILWLTVLFTSFGLFAPRNITAIVAIFLCALAISAAIKLVLDMDTPFDGLIRLAKPPIHISSDPLRHAIEVIRD
jgi:VIT1/CCC1 family predicted Fe2+/Mn2+ transporter